MIKLLKKSLLLAVFSLASISQPLFAAEMPCLKEVCIGDDLSKLRGINFKPVNPERAKKVSKKKQADRAEMFGKQPGANVPAYLTIGAFDENALDDMATIKAACHPLNSLEGDYVSESGYKTNVIVALWPDKSGNMKWLVKGLSRAYKGVQSRGESDQLMQDLREKYAQWDIAKVGQPKPSNAGMMLIPLREPILTLTLAPTPEVLQTENYKKNPLCKPSKKMSLD